MATQIIDLIATKPTAKLIITCIKSFTKIIFITKTGCAFSYYTCCICHIFNVFLHEFKILIYFQQPSTAIHYKLILSIVNSRLSCSNTNMFTNTNKKRPRTSWCNRAFFEILWRSWNTMLIYSVHTAPESNKLRIFYFFTIVSRFLEEKITSSSSNFHQPLQRFCFVSRFP